MARGKGATMKVFLFAVLAALLPVLAWAQTPADEAAARLKDPAVVARFNGSYAGRYYKDPENVINELAGSGDPDASAMLALIITGSHDNFYQGDAVSALGKRLKGPQKDVEALKFLSLTVKTASSSARCYALYALSGFLISPSLKEYPQQTVQSVIMPALGEAAKTASADPDRDVQSAYGSLSRNLSSWNTFDSPKALKGKAEYEAKEKRQSYIGLGVMALMPLTVIVAFVMLLAGGGGVLKTLLRPSAALSGVTGKCVQALRQDPALLLVPLACALVMAALTGGVAYSALHVSGLRPHMSRGEVEARAFELMLRPKMIAVYLAASYVMAVMFAEGAGLAAALERLPELAREGRGPALRSLFSMAAVRVESVIGAVFLPFLFCITLIPISVALGGDNTAWISSKIGLGTYDDYAVLFVGGVAGAVLMGSFFLALAQVLNSVLAVGVYFHDRGTAFPAGV